MKFKIPKAFEIRWQAALAVLEDLQEDLKAPFSMTRWADTNTHWTNGTHRCRTVACFGGYISVSPYCRALGFPRGNNGSSVRRWLLGDNITNEISHQLYEQIFSHEINKGSRAETLAYLELKLKSIFKQSTGKELRAPMTFYY